MSALSAIETPVAEVQEPRGAVTAESGRHERPIRVIACPVRSIADQDRDVAIGDDQPRSSSIPVTGIRPLAARRTGPRVVRASASSPAVLAGVVVGSPRATVPRATAPRATAPRATVRPASGVARTGLRLTRRGRIVVAALVIIGATMAALLITLLASGGAQATNHGAARGGYQGMHQVVVQPGQTLWSIAAAAEPSADPRTVIQRIMTANALAGPGISAGQQLWVP
ncbi:MAG TPA: LysM peptidoglycan-binding domain-containing protein [Streptosporangiaceae bacterium]|nr:LysM peptidoglycan-binding domain-containing protein [Streptosporangiaceae bacterium]